MSKPRKLTPEEIEDVVSVIGSSREVSVNSPIKESTEVANEALRNYLRNKLTKFEIVPQGIPKLKKQIANYFRRSRVVPGTPVGLQVSESIGGPATQMSLNAFHTAGSSSASNTGQGIERIQQLIDLTKKPKVTVSTVHFNTHLNYEGAYNKIRQDILAVSVGNLVLNFDIEDVSLLLRERPSWYDLYEDIYGAIPEIDYILRLEMNVKNMIAFAVTMEEVAEVIERGNPSTVRAVFSPMSIGIIDVYPIKEAILSSEEDLTKLYTDNAANIFLNTIVVDNLDNLQIKGVPGINKAFPISTPVMSILEEDFPYPEETDIWVMFLSYRRMLTSGIKKRDLERLLREANIEIVNLEEDREDIIIVRNPVRPSEAIRKALAEDNASRLLLEASQYYFIEVEGGKYEDILNINDVVPELTISNNIHEINEVLGIEAARKFYIREFYSLFVMQDLYIDVRHIELMADFISNIGILSAINTTGIGRQKIDSLAKATYRKPMDILARASTAGELHPVKAVSTHVLLGKEAPLGTGYVALLPNKEKERELLRSLKKVDEKFDLSSFSEGIDDLQDITYGAKNFTLNEKDLDEILTGVEPPLTPTFYGTGLRTNQAQFAGPITPTKIRPTPRVSLEDQLVPAPIVPDNLVEVAPLVSNIPVYREDNETTIEAVQEPEIKEVLRHAQENQSVFLKDENKSSRRLPITLQQKTGFTFTRTLRPPIEREVPTRSTAELLKELEE